MVGKVNIIMKTTGMTAYLSENGNQLVGHCNSATITIHIYLITGCGADSDTWSRPFFHLLVPFCNSGTPLSTCFSSSAFMGLLTLLIPIPIISTVENKSSSYSSQTQPFQCQSAPKHSRPTQTSHNHFNHSCIRTLSLLNLISNSSNKNFCQTNKIGCSESMADWSAHY